MNIFVSGDFNARTADRPDYVAHDDTNYISLPEDKTLDEDSNPRISIDTKAPNVHGHSLLDVCI